MHLSNGNKTWCHVSEKRCLAQLRRGRYGPCRLLADVSDITPSKRVDWSLFQTVILWISIPLFRFSFASPSFFIRLYHPLLWLVKSELYGLSVFHPVWQAGFSHSSGNNNIPIASFAAKQPYTTVRFSLHLRSSSMPFSLLLIVQQPRPFLERAHNGHYPIVGSDNTVHPRK